MGKAAGCAAVSLFTVALEIISGQAANSKNLSWVLVAAVAWGHRDYLVRSGLGSGRLLGMLLIAPFLLLAVGIAGGALSTTRH